MKEKIMTPVLTQSIQDHANRVRHALLACKDFSPVIPDQYLQTKPYVFNYTENNFELGTLDLSNADIFEAYNQKMIKENNCKYGVGIYNEDRILYRHSQLFDNEPGSRCIHLGMDLFVPALAPVFAPLAGTIHSFHDNNNFGDYGPTIILEHTLSGETFYTLHGHLHRDSLNGLEVGMKIKKGQEIGTIGYSYENGNWPEHLHFELMTDMLDKFGDFPGVASHANREFYTTICLNPNLILRLDI